MSGMLVEDQLAGAGKDGSEVKADYSDSISNGIVGKSDKILKVLRTIQKVAPALSTVMVTGESGTGKELIARSIHANSARCNEPMVVINCGAIPGELLESELFGHEKGAFTGAHRTRIGRLEMADGGTVFLDEIGDMSPDLQVKLLRAVQEQRFERVGSTGSIDVDIRIVSATNKDLMRSVSEGTFREDLFYRLNVIPIHVPPLRERKSDIPLLVHYFLDRLRERNGDQGKTMSDAAMECLVSYRWQGNIRELENLMERLSVLVDGDCIGPEDLPGYIEAERAVGKKDFASDILQEGLGFNEAVERHQRGLIIEALTRTNWVKAKAAELLQMNRTTLVEKIKKMKIEQPETSLNGIDII